MTCRLHSYLQSYDMLRDIVGYSLYSLLRLSHDNVILNIDRHW